MEALNKEKAMKTLFSTLLVAISIASPVAHAQSNFDKNNAIIENFFKTPINEHERIAVEDPKPNPNPGKSNFEQNNAKIGHLLNQIHKKDKDPEVIDKSKPYQSGQITEPVLNLRFYRGNKIPYHIQEKIGQTYTPDFLNYQKYVEIIPRANGTSYRIPVTDLPVYVVAKLPNGEQQTTILYPKKLK